MGVSGPLFKCSYCSYGSLNWKDLNRHNFVSHSNEPLILQRCIVSGCMQTFCCYSSFNSHLSQKHRGVDLQSEVRKSLLPSASGFPELQNTSNRISNEEAVSMDINDEVVEPIDFKEVTNEENEEDNMCSSVPSAEEDALQRYAALLLLTSKECYKVTQSAINYITQQVQLMFSFAVDDIEEIVNKYLEDQGILADTTELNARLESLCNPFGSIGTEHMQTKCYREKFHLVVRVDLVIYSCYEST